MKPNGRWMSSVLGRNGGNPSGAPGYCARYGTLSYGFAPSTNARTGWETLLRKSTRTQSAAPRRKPPSPDSEVARTSARPSAATNDVAARTMPDRLAMPNRIHVGLRKIPTGLRMRDVYPATDSVDHHALDSAQRPPVDVFHQDVRELAVSSNAVETIDARGPLEALTIHLVFVEKDRIRDGRARDVGPKEPSPNAGDDRLEVV